MQEAKGFQGETSYVPVDSYRQYQLCASRFDLAIRLKIQLLSVDNRTSGHRPRISHCQEKYDSAVSAKHLSARDVVIATDKTRIPNRNNSDDFADRLAETKIPFLHATDSGTARRGHELSRRQNMDARQ